MDPMQLAQLKRQAEWYAQEVRHSDRDLQAAELAFEGAKKKVEELRKKHLENKRKLDVFTQDILRAQEETRRNISNQRH
ncbi:MAG: hypothetical protein WC050_00330 [Candidatus Paceibacterota bacterium]